MAGNSSPKRDAAAEVRSKKAGTKGQATRENIISAATALFRQKGYARTALSEIARQAGMDPSSFYYYFTSKEALLNSIFDQSSDAPSVADLELHTSSRGAQLYALIVYDIVGKCELPFDFNEMETIATENREQFSSFFEHYRALYHSILTIIERGIAEGEFIACSADERTVTILSLDEGLQHHFHAKHRKELILEASGYAVRNYEPEDIARMGARSIMPSLISDQKQLEEAIESGRQLYFRLKQND